MQSSEYNLHIYVMLDSAVDFKMMKFKWLWKLHIDVIFILVVLFFVLATTPIVYYIITVFVLLFA